MPELFDRFELTIWLLIKLTRELMDKALLASDSLFTGTTVVFLIDLLLMLILGWRKGGSIIFFFYSCLMILVRNYFIIPEVGH